MNNAFSFSVLSMLCIGSANADLVELEISGTFTEIQSDGVLFGNPIPTDRDLSTETWSLTVLYDTDHLFTLEGAARSATLQIGNEVFQALDARDAEGRYFWDYGFSGSNGNEVADVRSSDSIGMRFSFGDSMELRLQGLAEADWWEHIYDGSGSWNSHNNAQGMPTDYELNDFMSLSGAFNTSRVVDLDNGVGLISEAFDHWTLNVDAMTARVVPSPSALLVVVAGLAIRRRR